MVRKTLQIATLASNSDPVLTGIKSFPVHKLHLIYMERHWEVARALMQDLSRVLRVEVVEFMVPGTGLFDYVMDGVSRIVAQGHGSFQDVLVNVSSGDRPLDFAALVSAFTNGVNAFTVVDGEPFMMPMLKFSYERSVSETKMEILRAILSVGGNVESLAKLNEITGYGKPLLSYHILGTHDSRGLVRLGLVEVLRGHRGTAIIRATTMGRLLAQDRLETGRVNPKKAWEEPRRVLVHGIGRPEIHQSLADATRIAKPLKA